MRFEKYLNEAKNMKIYLDMDGVLTDFNKTFEDMEGQDAHEYNNKYGDDKFWELIKEKGGLKFWSEMPWVKGSKKLWNYVKNKDVAILSAPARAIPDCPKGKKIWVKRELGNVKLILKRAREKHEYAEDNDCILIDDNEKNIATWKIAGGIGILFKSASQAIKELKKYEI